MAVEAARSLVPRILLVGEYNPHSRADAHALLPTPKGATGDRLRRIIGVSTSQYMRAFDRTNLLMTPRWDGKLARQVADGLTHTRRILLGARVAAAHGLKFLPFHRFLVVYPFKQYRALILPHPSGLCRIWNERGAAKAARDAVARFILEFPREECERETLQSVVAGR